MRVKLIAANWKMNMGRGEVLSYLQEFSRLYRPFPGVETAICPPFVWLEMVKNRLPAGVALGAQNVATQEKGAYTGEVAAFMLRDIGCRYVIIGHSERRHLMGEDDKLIGRKLEQALAVGLTPILCVGETREERQKGEAHLIVTRQLKEGLSHLKWDPESLVIAYEPVWAIGTGENATPEDAEEMAHLIRDCLEEIKQGAAERVRILYGGSVNPENARDLLEQPDIDGALVGGASLDPVRFASIVESGRSFS